nr:Coatomer subunit beta-1 [Ipomoea batatas]GMD90779.1 Coatomer subunit beta-1 [Ipomoea batatas]
MVQTTVLPVSTVFLTVLITIAAALASSPEVGSSMNMMEGFATNSTAIPEILAKVSCFFGYPEILMSPSMYPPVFLPANTSIRVVFPAPLTPIKAVRTPGLKAPLTPFNSTNLSSLAP